jgi:hypothetical protein
MLPVNVAVPISKSKRQNLDSLPLLTIYRMIYKNSELKDRMAAFARYTKMLEGRSSKEEIEYFKSKLD